MSLGRDLIVIEAPGKLRSVYRSFEALGIDVEVVATLGHLYENSPRLQPLGIALVGDQFIETDRRPQRPESFGYLKSALARCAGRIVIATDDDAEGHVIAQDVADLASAVGAHAAVVRALPHALSPEGWRSAVQSARPLDPEAARAGTARRLVDRIMAGTMLSGKGHAVGRVQAALLGIASNHELPDRMVCLSVAALDRGRPFLGVGAVHGECAIGELSDGLAIASTGNEPLNLPPHGGDALLALHDQLGLSMTQASDLLQSMYEAGEISYPRSSGRGLRATGAAAIAMLAQSRAIRGFNRGLLPRLAESGGPAHEAVHLVMSGMVERLDLGRPLRLCKDMREAAALVIGRRSVECGIGVSRDRPVLAALPGWARKLDWSREGRAPALPWRGSDKPMMQSLDLAAGTVRAQIHHGLGRPSTWAGHAQRLAESGWIAPSHSLSISGRAQLESVPGPLRDPAISAAIERLLEDPQHSVRDRVIGALELAVGGDSSAVSRLLQSLTQDMNDETPDFTFAM